MGDNDEMTTAEHLMQIRKIVLWTLWRIATTDPQQGPTGLAFNFQKHLPIRSYDTGQIGTIHGYAEDLFKDSSWVIDTVSSFTVHEMSPILMHTVDWAAFEAAIRSHE
jgi:hypothetical protein